MKAITNHNSFPFEPLNKQITQSIRRSLNIPRTRLTFEQRLKLILFVENSINNKKREAHYRLQMYLN